MKNPGLFVVVAVLAACGGSRPRANAQVQEPRWLAEGNGAVMTEGGKQVHAIGVVQGVRSSKDRRQQADEKARARLAQTMDQVFASLSRSSELTRANLSGEVSAIGKKAMAQTEKIMDHWVSGDTESALDVLDLQAFKAALQRVDGDEKLKQEMAGKVERALDQVAKQ